MFDCCTAILIMSSELVEIRAMYRIVAPGAAKRPFSCIYIDKSDELRAAVDIVREWALNMIIQSFGSGVNMESDDEGYLARVKWITISPFKGIEIGATRSPL